MPLLGRLFGSLNRGSWTRNAKARLEVRVHPSFGFRVELRGPSDGSGCVPPGEYKQHATRWRSTKAKAVNEAIAYCDASQIKINEFPEGFGYSI